MALLAPLPVEDPTKPRKPLSSASWQLVLATVGRRLRKWLEQTGPGAVETGHLDAVIADIEAMHEIATWDALDWFVMWLLSVNAPLWRVDTLPRIKPDTDRIHNIARARGPQWFERLLDKGVPRQEAIDRSVDTLTKVSYDYLVYDANTQLGEAGDVTNAVTRMRTVQGYRRVPRDTACAFCRMIAGAAKKHPVYNVTERWTTPHLGCKCVLEPVPGAVREERIRSAEEIMMGRLMHDYIKSAKDREIARREAGHRA